MKVKVDRYVDLLTQYSLYGDDGYYVDPFIIKMMIVDEVNLPMSFNEIKEFVSEASITLTEEEIKKFLDKTMDEEEPTLRCELENSFKPFPHNINEWTEDDIKRAGRRYGTLILKRRYEFDPNSLQYFKTYVSILKEKLKTLFDILNDIDKCKNGSITKEGLNRILDLDFNINSKGNVYILDLERLADAIIYNIKDLYFKVIEGNNPSTYLEFKKSFNLLDKIGSLEKEDYPSKEVQIKDLHYAYQSEFIALSKKQKENLKNDSLENFKKIYKNVLK